VLSKGDSDQSQQASQQQREKGQMNLGAKGDHLKYEEHQEDSGPKREVTSLKDYENLETWQNLDVYHGIHHIDSSLLPSGLLNTLDPNSLSMTKITRFVIHFFRYVYLLSCI
jgi:hypothetical protein